MDETTAPVLDPGRGQTKKGFFWAIAADDRGYGGTGRRSSCSDTRRGEAANMPNDSWRDSAGDSFNATAMTGIIG